MFDDAVWQPLTHAANVEIPSSAVQYFSVLIISWMFIAAHPFAQK